MADSFHHRPGPMHQSNKPFKGRKRTQPKTAVKGRTETAPSGVKHHAGVKKQTGAQQTKSDRRNLAKQIIKKKREDMFASRRCGTAEGAPKLIALIALGPDVDPLSVKRALLMGTGLEDGPMNDAPVTFIHKTSKQRFTILTPPREIIATLDSAKIADIIVPILGPAASADAFGDRVVDCMHLQGLASVVPVLVGDEALNPRRAKDARSTAIDYFRAHFAIEEKLHVLNSETDASTLWRTLSVHRLRSIQWRERRSYVLAQALVFDPVTVNPETQCGTALLSGFIRGAALHAAQIMHIPGVGDFQIEAILHADDPFPMRRQASVAGLAPVVLAACTPEERDPLQEENDASPFDAEQTWPTEEEEAQAGMLRRRVVKKLVPKGTSDYQAAWVFETQEEDAGPGAESDGDSNESGSGDGEAMSADEAAHGSDAGSEKEQEVQFRDDLDGDDADEKHVDFPMESDAGSEFSETPTEKADERLEELAARKSIERQKLLDMAQQDALFADEVETPIHLDARSRFRKYRGLKSFRSTPWPARENLPQEYARIFQYADFKMTAKRALQARERSIPNGAFVTIRLLNVPVAAIDALRHPVVAWSLLKHERKVSMLHFAVQRHASYTAPMRSKDPVVIQCGFRRYVARPLYSQNNVSSDKHKFERFLQPGRFSVASVFAHTTFPPMPVMIFKEESYGLELAAKGSLLSVDPDRVLVKKIVLTGFPYRVNRRFAVVRFMFFNPDDIRYFKPVELWTKHGLRGHIREPRGTKGYMKCIFDRPIKMNDTICLSLYKRVFPPYRAAPLSILPQAAAVAHPAGAMPPPMPRQVSIAAAAPTSMEA